MIKSRIPLEKFVKEYSVRNKLNEDIPVYSVTNSQGFCTEYFSKEVASQDKTTYKIVPRGYFAYNPSRINVGSVDWQKYEDRVIVSPLYNVFSVSDEIDCQYLYYFFRSNIGRQMIKAKSSGSVRDNLKIEMLKEMTIPDISMREQQFCSSVLDKLQILIKLKCDEIKQMDELVKARFVEMFGDIKNEEKYSGILLGNICKTISGGTPSTKITEYYTGDIPWISTVSLGPNHIDGKLAKGYITSLAIKNSATKLIPAGNILFGTRVGVGKSSINDVEMCTNQDIVAIVDVDECKYNKLFIKCVLDSYQAYFDSIKKGATIFGVTSDDLKDCLIPNVPINIQNEFVVFVEQVDKSKSVIEKSLKELETLQASLMQKYFS